jgi:serine/threonine-protein kinase
MKCESSSESVAARPVPEVRGYVLEEVIGRGGAGVVWRGVQEGTLREVAVKFLGPWQGLGLAELRFEREAEIAGGLEHENIVRVFDSGESGSGRWLAMELVNGPTVDGWVALDDPPLRRRMRSRRC